MCIKFAIRIAAIAIVGSAVIVPVCAQSSATAKFWKPASRVMSQVSISVENPLAHVTRYQGYVLNEAALRSMLTTAPDENAYRSPLMPQLEISLPTPKGFQKFRVFEFDLMSADLQRENPEIRTYRAQGIDDPFATAALDFTPSGFHGMIVSPTGTTFIAPTQIVSNGNYAVYDKRDTVRTSSFACEVLNDGADIQAVPSKDLPRREGPLTANGTNLRTLRLAMSATAQYTAFFGSVATAEAAIVTSVNRVSFVYEYEQAYRFNLVFKKAWPDAATDPFADTFSSTLLSQNQTTLDSNPGNAAYDFGHVFTISDGGVASLGVVGTSGAKARGSTGRPSPIGDAFDIDYVAHEMGHQFGGNHTFAGTIGSCAGNGNASTAWEPGSGSTIQAYAGICGSNNVQSNSDPFFHVGSYEEILAYMATRASTGTNSSTGNNIPVIPAMTNYTVPISTPYILTGPTATDANGDPLTYNWELFNVGTLALVRSAVPLTTPKRFIPKLTTVLGTATNNFETLPTTARTQTWRMTVRDMRAGGGGVDWKAATVTVVAGGAFTVTAPNTAVTWVAGSTQSVTWTQGGGTATIAPNVDIFISSNGGTSFGNDTATLVGTFPNTGSATITVPNLVSTTCRLFVKASGGIFYDVSNVNFTINAANAAPVLSPIGNKVVNEESPLTFTASATDANAGQVLTYSLVGAPTGASINPSTGAFTFTPTEAQGPAIYTFTVKVTDNGSPALSAQESIDVTVNEVQKLIRGQVDLQDIVDSNLRNGQIVEVQVRDVGSLTAFVTQNATLDTSGNFSFDTTAIAPGSYDIAVKGSHWLRQVAGSIAVASTGTAITAYSLINGDIDGDNVVSILDYAILSDYFDKDSSGGDWNTVGGNGFSPAQADLDLDGVVSILDYSILSANFDVIGQD